MKPAARSLKGDFRARDLSPGGKGRGGSWLLSTGAPAGPDIYLCGVDPEAAPVLRGHHGDVDLEWHGDGVRVTLRSSGVARVLQARSAVLHEPLADLYDVLPLARFDPEARRFWRRVFRLVRIPGGRYLLRFVARRARAPE